MGVEPSFHGRFMGHRGQDNQAGVGRSEKVAKRRPGALQLALVISCRGHVGTVVLDGYPIGDQSVKMSHVGIVGGEIPFR